MPTRPAVDQPGPSTKRQKSSHNKGAAPTRGVPVKEEGSQGQAEASEGDDDEEEHRDEDESNSKGDHEQDDVFSRPTEMFSTSYVQQIYSAFTAGKASGSEGTTKGGTPSNATTSQIQNANVHNHPFPSLQLLDVFSNDLVSQARRQLINEVTFNQKGNDLYSYRGSGDLSDPEVCPDGTPLAKLRDALYSEQFTKFISSATGVKLFSGRPDLSSHQYWNGDHLLAHDDDIQGEMEFENEGRRIAFILYLVDEKWSSKDGGALDLFECDKEGHPTTIQHSIVPAFNSIALFEVAPTSYHQVAEVTLGNVPKTSPPYRLSISGWFHGPLNSRLALPLATLPASLAEGTPPLADFVNPTYLDKSTQETVNASLINDSSIELRGFLAPKLWERVQDELARSSYDTSPQNAVGPAHLRHYYNLPGTPVLDQLRSFFKSPDFLKLLSAFTSLDFLPSETKARVRGRMWKQGSYTLLHDQGNDPDGVDILLGLGTKRLGNPSADASIAANKNKGKGKVNGSSGRATGTDEDDDEELEEQGWSTRWGGQTCYCPNRMALEDDEEKKEDGEGEDGQEDDSDSTLTILPGPNTLSIIVRSLRTLKFVKYVNDSARDPVDGCPLARCDIEGVFEVDLGEDEEFEGEVEESDDADEQEHEEWSGIGAADGEDELA